MHSVIPKPVISAPESTSLQLLSQLVESLNPVDACQSMVEGLRRETASAVRQPEQLSSTALV